MLALSLLNPQEAAIELESFHQSCGSAGGGRSRKAPEGEGQQLQRAGARAGADLASGIAGGGREEGEGGGGSQMLIQAPQYLEFLNVCAERAVDDKVYIYIHIYIYIYIYVCVCVCVCIYVRVYIYICLYICINIYIY
jgi:hypothetical protein